MLKNLLLGLGTEGSDTLTTVDIETPDGLAIKTGDARKEGGKGGLGIVILKDVTIKTVEQLHLAIGSNITGSCAGLSHLGWPSHAHTDETQDDNGDGADGPFFPVRSSSRPAIFWRICLCGTIIGILKNQTITSAKGEKVK